ncbi:MAG: hypothetical protein ABFS34_13780 [Gemmatimonadota bacterium]
MDELIVVTYPQPLTIEARRMDHHTVPDDGIGLAYYFRGNVIARGVVSREGLEAIDKLLRTPVPVALAASEDEDGNIDARVCLVLPVQGQGEDGADDEGAEEPWRNSVPSASFEDSVPAPPWEQDDGSPYGGEGGDKAHVALLPIGNVVRSSADRHHSDVAGDAREMLENLLAGQARDADQKAIDDLLRSL